MPTVKRFFATPLLSAFTCCHCPDAMTLELVRSLSPYCYFLFCALLAIYARYPFLLSNC